MGGPGQPGRRRRAVQGDAAAEEGPGGGGVRGGAGRGAAPLGGAGRHRPLRRPARGGDLRAAEGGRGPRRRHPHGLALLGGGAHQGRQGPAGPHRRPTPPPHRGRAPVAGSPPLPAPRRLDAPVEPAARPDAARGHSPRRPHRRLAAPLQGAGLRPRGAEPQGRAARALPPVRQADRLGQGHPAPCHLPRHAPFVRDRRGPRRRHRGGAEGAPPLRRAAHHPHLRPPRRPRPPRGAGARLRQRRRQAADTHFKCV